MESSLSDTIQTSKFLGSGRRILLRNVQLVISEHQQHVKSIYTTSTETTPPYTSQISSAKLKPLQIIVSSKRPPTVVNNQLLHTGRLPLIQYCPNPDEIEDKYVPILVVETYNSRPSSPVFLEDRVAARDAFRFAAGIREFEKWQQRAY